MKEELLKYMEHPKELEKLYLKNKTDFKKEFNLLYPSIKDTVVAQFWNERLNHKAEISWGTNKELFFVIFISLLAGVIAKIPEFMGFEYETFYSRNSGFIVFPLLSIYFIWKNQISRNKQLIALATTLVALVYINMLPNTTNSDTLILSCIHLPLFLWTLLGFAFVGKDVFNPQKRLDFLRYNGDLVVMSAIMLIAGVALTGITIGLFSLININIEYVYTQYIAVFGLAALPIVATYVVQTNPQLVNNVSPVIAKIFSPLVLITLVVYLTAIIYSGKDPYNDREFLLLFNALLIGVMAIILFSVVGTSRTEKSQLTIGILFLLSVVTISVNAIALSAILFRISEWGITPNRLAVLGGNILILINLLIVAYRLFKTIKQAEKIELVEQAIASFLPLYSLWTIIVTFLFPLLFSYK